MNYFSLTWKWLVSFLSVIPLLYGQMLLAWVPLCSASAMAKGGTEFTDFLKEDEQFLDWGSS
jgi:hypothetical protein